MDIFIYSDESGVFDKIHNDFYVYGGVILLSKNDRDICSRKYSAAEKTIADRYKEGTELTEKQRRILIIYFLHDYHSRGYHSPYFF